MFHSSLTFLVQSNRPFLNKDIESFLLFWNIFMNAMPMPCHLCCITPVISNKFSNLIRCSQVRPWARPWLWCWTGSRYTPSISTRAVPRTGRRLHYGQAPRWGLLPNIRFVVFQIIIVTFYLIRNAILFHAELGSNIFLRTEIEAVSLSWILEQIFGGRMPF